MGRRERWVGLYPSVKWYRRSGRGRSGLYRRSGRMRYDTDDVEGLCGSSGETDGIVSVGEIVQEILVESASAVEEGMQPENGIPTPGPIVVRSFEGCLCLCNCNSLVR